MKFGGESCFPGLSSIKLDPSTIGFNVLPDRFKGISDPFKNASILSLFEDSIFSKSLAFLT